MSLSEEQIQYQKKVNAESAAALAELERVAKDFDAFAIDIPENTKPEVKPTKEPKEPVQTLPELPTATATATDITLSDGMYVPLGDSGKKYQYAKYPKVSKKLVDFCNKYPDEYEPNKLQKWCQHHEVSRGGEEWRKVQQEVFDKHVSKWQHTDPSEPNYIDLNHPIVIAGKLEECANPLAREDRLDRLADKIEETERLRKAREDFNNGGRERAIKQEARKNAERKEALDRAKYIKGEKSAGLDNSKERSMDRDATREKRAGFDENNRSYHLIADQSPTESNSESESTTDQFTDSGQARTPIDYWDIGLATLEEKYRSKLEVVFTGEGNWGGIEFGMKSEFRQLKGLNVPKGAYYYKSLKKIHRGLMCTIGVMQKDARNFWLGCFSGEGHKSAIAKFAKNTDIQDYKTVSIDGNLAWKVIPPKEWFSEEVQKINPRDLLSILPDAEADTFLLHLGRTALGVCKEPISEDMPSSSKIVELKNFLYDYRYAMLLHGTAGTGKSSLIENIVRAFSYAGYTFDVLGTAFNQFGWDAVQNDIVFCDDLGKSSILNLLRSEKVKTAISGNVQDVENKGVDGRKVQSKASFIFSTNDVYFPKDYDPGVADRIHFLETKSKSELKALTQLNGVSAFTIGYWQHLKNTMTVDTTTLGLWLISCGLDEFLKACDVKKEVTEDGQVRWYRDMTRSDQMPEYITRLEENARKYRFQPPINERTYLPRAARKAFVYAKMLKPSLKVPFEYDDSFNAFTLKHLAETLKALHVHITKKENDLRDLGVEESPHIEFMKDVMDWIIDGRKIISNSIWMQFINLWAKEVGDNTRLGQDKLTFEPLWKKCIQSITTIEGRPLCEERQEYDKGFTSAKYEETSKVFSQQLELLMKKHGIDLASEDNITKSIIRHTAITFTSFDSTEIF